MNLQDLRYFVAVATYRHFGKAASECFVSQPTLSGQLRKLEETLGVTLFERTNKRVSLTPIGERLLPHARKALDEALLIQEIAAKLQDQLQGSLRLGIIPTLAPYLIPLWLDPMKKAHPRIEVELWEDLTESLLQLLREHRLDAVLLATEEDDKELHSIRLFTEPFLAALPVGHPLAKEKRVKEEDLRPDVLVLAEGHCLAKQSLDACGGDTYGKRSVRDGHLRAASLDTLLNLVAAGYGTTLVPALAAETMEHRRLALRPLTGGASRNIYLLTRVTYPRPQAVDAVQHVVREVLRERNVML